MQADQVIDQAGRRLNDYVNVSWTRAHLAHALAFVLREMQRLQPSIFSRTDTMQLAQGYEQAVPSDVDQFLGGIRNMGSNGSTPGRAIRNADKETAEAVLPNISGATPGSVVRDIYWSAREPRTFWVYPPVPASPDVYIQYRAAKTPPTGSNIAGNESQQLTPTDQYMSVVIDGVVAHALSRQVVDPSNPQQADPSFYWQQFYGALGATTEQGQRR